MAAALDGRRIAILAGDGAHIGAETLDYEKVDVPAELRERTGGRGPDVRIEAVGMEAHSPGPQYLYDQVKQQLRLQSDRPTAVRQAIYACRKGGTVFTFGVFAGLVDKFPLGAVMNKALTLRGAQQHGHRCIPEILDRMSRGEVRTEHLATDVMPLDDGRRATGCSRTRRTGASVRCSVRGMKRRGADRHGPGRRTGRRVGAGAGPPRTRRGLAR